MNIEADRVLLQRSGSFPFFPRIRSEGRDVLLKPLGLPENAPDRKEKHRSPRLQSGHNSESPPDDTVVRSLLSRQTAEPALHRLKKAGNGNRPEGLPARISEGL